MAPTLISFRVDRRRFSSSSARLGKSSRVGAALDASHSPALSWLAMPEGGSEGMGVER